MLVCPKCGTAAPEGTGFCGRCGTELAGPELASFGRRLGGLLIDAFLIIIVITIATDIIIFVFDIWLDRITSALALNAGYVVVLNANGGTLGKRVLGIRLEDAATGKNIGYGRAIVRWLVAFPSALALFAGYFWAIWDENRQTWHDKAAGSVVVRGR